MWLQLSDMKVLLLLVSLVATATASYKSYAGYRTYEIVPRNAHERSVILDLVKDNHELDFLLESRAPGQPTHIMVPPHRVPGFVNLLQDNRIDFTVLVPDVGVKVAAERRRLQTRDMGIMAYNNSDFNTYADIMSQLDVWAATCPTGFTCTVDTLGLSYEGRDIKRLTISQGSGRPTFWMDSAIHAREWLSPATNLRILEHFITNYGRDPDATDLLDTYDWMFVPVMNPDGYDYTWTNDRYWRKSRNVNPSNTSCPGTDLNRNYDAEWGVSGTSDDPCSGVYKGDVPASAPETQIIQGEVDRIWNSLQGSVSIHTYGHLLLHPYGHENETDSDFCVFAPTHDQLFAVSEAMANAIFAVSNYTWTYGNSCDKIYPASGITMDYFYNKGTQVPYSYTPELRGDDFVIDPSQIDPSFQEMWAAIVAMVNTIEQTLA